MFRSGSESSAARASWTRIRRLITFSAIPTPVPGVAVEDATTARLITVVQLAGHQASDPRADAPNRPCEGSAGTRRRFPAGSLDNRYLVGDLDRDVHVQDPPAVVFLADNGGQSGGELGAVWQHKDGRSTAQPKRPSRNP